MTRPSVIDPQRNWLMRILRGVVWRLVWPTRMTIFAAPQSDQNPPVPEGFALTRVKASSPGADIGLVEDAMRAAGEPDGLVGPRFAHGDECFGWLVQGRIVSFGWAMYRDRIVGGARLADMPGRIFFYNFHTSKEYRGRQLFPALKLSMCFILSCDGMTQFISDISDRNTASLRGIQKTCFVPAARLTFLTLLNRWSFPVKRTLLDPAFSSLF